MELEQARAGVKSGAVDDLSECTAARWLERVEGWRENLRRALHSDAVPAPVQPEQRWLLYLAPRGEGMSSGGVDIPSESAVTASASLACPLCRKCREALSAKDGVRGRAPKAWIPSLARANGLWGGPEPRELAVLSYVERKVIQLARLYICVKRVYLDSPVAARVRRDEQPLYHEKNVVAYPQDLDVVATFCGAPPADLARTLVVQFVGHDRSRLRCEPALCVDVARLRSAFEWLAHNELLALDDGDEV